MFPCPSHRAASFSFPDRPPPAKLRSRGPSPSGWALHSSPRTTLRKPSSPPSMARPATWPSRAKSATPPWRSSGPSPHIVPRLCSKPISGQKVTTNVTNSPLSSHHPGTQAVEVYCRLPREEASRRFAERARHERHHPAHALAEMSPDRIVEYEEPFALTALIEVDTTMPVALDALVSRIQALLSPSS